MCVCSRESCRSSRLSSPVCASNNMTFDSLCLMEAWKCENYRSGLYKKYDGKCQSSFDCFLVSQSKICQLPCFLAEDCQNVKCPETDVCVLVKNNGEPICYPKKHCNPNAHPGPVCGVNGVTYPNVCALNLNRNKQGRTIDLAHRGACGPLKNFDVKKRRQIWFFSTISESKCREDLCQKDETCVYSKQLRPVCIRCQYPEGFLRLSGECSERVPVCADNGRLYPSYCSLLTDQCRKSRYFNIISYQKCPDRSRKFSPKNFIDRLG